MIFVKTKTGSLKNEFKFSNPAGCVHIVKTNLGYLGLLEYGQALRYEEFLSDWSDSMQRVIIIDLLECLAPARHLVHRLTLRVWCDMGIARSGVAGKLGRTWVDKNLVYQVEDGEDTSEFMAGLVFQINQYIHQLYLGYDWTCADIAFETTRIRYMLRWYGDDNLSYVNPCQVSCSGIK